MDDDTLQKLYEWIDSVPTNRPSRSLERDFSDATRMAELIHHFYPKLVSHLPNPCNHDTRSRLPCTQR